MYFYVLNIDTTLSNNLYLYFGMHAQGGARNWCLYKVLSIIRASNLQILFFKDSTRSLLVVDVLLLITKKNYHNYYSAWTKR